MRQLFIMGAALAMCSGTRSLPPLEEPYSIKDPRGLQQLIYQENLNPNLIKYEILMEDLEIKNDKILGGGTFGNNVSTGLVKHLFFGDEPSLIVVKRSDPSVVDSIYFRLFLSELKLLSSMSWHENIVTFLGVAVGDAAKREIYMVLEYCSKGNLLNYLRMNQPQPTEFLEQFPNLQSPNGEAESTFHRNVCTKENLLNWSYQIASGMDFIAGLQIVHGDLICKNILLTDKLMAKIADFTIAKTLGVDEQSYTLTEPIPLPWRWMAIESLQDLKFSVQSDVWSYGIVLWEIFSLGEIPYAGFSWNPDFVTKLIEGLRPLPPKFVTTPIYEFMLTCWDENSSKRPAFSEAMNFFSEMLESSEILEFGVIIKC